MSTKKAFKDLNLSNSFLFAVTLADPETCRLVLEVILGKPIPKVNVHTEHSILFSSDIRSVRLDVYAYDEMQVVYNLEMQGENEGNLPKRSRGYQGQMDVASLVPGSNFNELPPSYVIFICTFDPFEDQLYQYTIEEICHETQKPFPAETKKIFLNTKGKNHADVSEELMHFLKYVEQTTDSCVADLNDEMVAKIHAKVSQVKLSREMEARYMTVEELMQRHGKKEREEGIKQGIGQGIKQGIGQGIERGLEQGQERMLTLINKMVAAGLSEKIPQLSTDEEFLKSMYKTYDL